MDDREATLRSLEGDWRAALLAKDEPALHRMIHPDFKLVGVRPNGDPISIDLASWIRALKTMDIAAVEFDVLEAVGDDHTLIGTLDACWKVRLLHQCIDERVLLTDVWLRNGQTWRVIRRHTSFVRPRTEDS
ncbi:MAG: nuclear transport factor 2 family protein [Pseudomonadota bacterium]|nr:nuclear transport factor 2 family protein [Pseudomonadota bacterium]